MIMPLEDRLERLKELISLHAGHLETVRIRCAAGKNEGAWWNLRCDALALPTGAPYAPRGRYEYRNTVLVERTCSLAALPNFILEAGTGQAMFDETTVKFGKLFEDSQLVRDALPPMLFESPVYRVVFPFTGRAPTSDEPHIVRGAPFYSNGDMAVHDWCDVDYFNYGRPYGAVIVRLPQCRARFDKLLIDSDKLRITFHGDAATLSEAMVKGQLWSLSNVEKVEAVNLSPERPVEVTVPNQPLAAELYLVDRAGEILDRHVEGAVVEPWRERILPNWSRIESEIATVREALRTGEDRHTEFKTFIEPRDPKMREIPETVVAFANTEGGILVVGIDDHGALVGIERGLVKMTRHGSNLTEATKTYAGHVRKAITDVLNRLPGLHISPVEIDGHTVMAVFAEEGAEKPYALRDTRDIYVRRGSNNVKPDPDTELRPLVEKKQQRWPWAPIQ